MRVSTRLTGAWLGALGVMLAGASGEEAPADSDVRVQIHSPSEGEVVRGRFELAPFAGVASAGDRPTRFDVILVIDVSASTRYPSGVDVDGDGRLGRREPPVVRGLPEVECSDPGDSVLAAELVAARALIDELDSERVHLGVVGFSGLADPTGESAQPESVKDATLHQPLSGDYALVRAALDRIAAAGPTGGTNMAHGVRLATRELAGREGALSQPRADARKVMLFLTDGKPSLPHGSPDLDDPEDIEAAADAARLAAEAGIVINVYGLGAEANDRPAAPREMTRATGGVYEPVDLPGEIVAVFSGVSFANVDSVVAVNLTSGEAAEVYDIRLRPDGTFQGFVPVRPGKNRVRVSAFSTGGRRGSAEFTIDFRHSELSSAEKEAELERVRERTRAILIESERVKQEAYRQRERRRSLEIEPDKPSRGDQ
jgi:Mg-chelatase subunit ChlD